MIKYTISIDDVSLFSRIPKGGGLFMKYFWLLLGIIAVVAVGFIPVLPPDPDKVNATHGEAERVFAGAKAEYEKSIDRSTLEIWGLRYGDATAAKMYQCKHDPPRKPRNQQWCQQMFARDAKADAEWKAKEDRERANW